MTKRTMKSMHSSQMTNSRLAWKPKTGGPAVIRGVPLVLLFMPMDVELSVLLLMAAMPLLSMAVEAPMVLAVPAPFVPACPKVAVPPAAATAAAPPAPVELCAPVAVCTPLVEFDLADAFW